MHKRPKLLDRLERKIPLLKVKEDSAPLSPEQHFLFKIMKRMEEKKDHTAAVESFKNEIMSWSPATLSEMIDICQRLDDGKLNVGDVKKHLLERPALLRGFLETELCSRTRKPQAACALSTHAAD